MKNLFMFDAGYIGNEPAPKPVKPKRVLPAAWEAFNVVALILANKDAIAKATGAQP